MRLKDVDNIDNLLYLEQKRLESNDDRTWERNKKYYRGIAFARRILEDAPTIEKKGKWLETKKHKNFFMCSLCNYIPWLDDEFENKVPYYCPNCGADMRGGEEWK